MPLTLDILRIAQGLVLVLGLIIVYYAVRGYTRTKSRSLLLLAIGFAFVSVGALLGGTAFELLDSDLQTADALQAVAQAIGFFIIVLSLTAIRD